MLWNFYDEDVTLDMCPISNYKLKVIDQGIGSHRLKNLLKGELGVRSVQMIHFLSIIQS